MAYTALFRISYTVFSRTNFSISREPSNFGKKHTNPLALNGTGFLERSDSSFSHD